MRSAHYAPKPRRKGEKPALGMNQGILYLMFTPLIIIGFLAYRWWKFNKEP